MSVLFSRVLWCRDRADCLNWPTARTAQQALERSSLKLAASRHVPPSSLTPRLPSVHVHPAPHDLVVASSPCLPHPCRYPLVCLRHLFTYSPALSRFQQTFGYFRPLHLPRPGRNKAAWHTFELCQRSAATSLNLHCEIGLSSPTCSLRRLTCFPPSTPFRPRYRVELLVTRLHETEPLARSSTLSSDSTRSRSRSRLAPHLRRSQVVISLKHSSVQHRTSDERPPGQVGCSLPLPAAESSGRRRVLSPS